MMLPCQVVEAVLEDVGLKQRIFADLEKACCPDCILSTSTMMQISDVSCIITQRFCIARWWRLCWRMSA